MKPMVLKHSPSPQRRQSCCSYAGIANVYPWLNATAATGRIRWAYGRVGGWGPRSRSRSFKATMSNKYWNGYDRPISDGAVRGTTPTSAGADVRLRCQDAATPDGRAAEGRTPRQAVFQALTVSTLTPSLRGDANGSGFGRPDDRLRIEPGHLVRVPDAQLRIDAGAMHHPGMTDKGLVLCL